ncbi:FAD-binding oxidoreductase [Plantactinospora sp. CA-290183]|uniref:FAD-binding oxidoreductase n=1 Tax=Plantactinospora sp. CA-290183 TaxID=3240006 RepID=UPI003D8F875A
MPGSAQLDPQLAALRAAVAGADGAGAGAVGGAGTDGGAGAGAPGGDRPGGSGGRADGGGQDGGEIVRPAGERDAVAGVPARFVAVPGSTGQAAALLRAAAAQRLAVVVRGAGTKQDWGAPPRALDLLLDTRRLTGVVEHAAGDLIVVVRAGTRLGDLRAALAPAGQQLGLDDPLPGATVGGTVSVNTSGPRRMLYGTARDLLIGVTMVRADGVVAHAGGKVVKNVAGYDLGKLLTGAYGTLGLITECVFRLHPVPAATAYVRCRADGVPAAERLVAAVLRAQLAPSALELDAPPGGGIDVVVLLAGTPAGVAGRAEAARRLFGADATIAAGAPAGWGRYPWRTGDVGLKLTGVLSGVPDLVAAARAVGDRHGVPIGVRGSAGTGVLYAGVPAATAPERVHRVVEELRGAAREAGGHAVVLTAPAPVRDRLDLWGPVEGLALMRRVKDQFDPDARLAPGRFVGGI